jgi:hypothetical protein
MKWIGTGLNELMCEKPGTDQRRTISNREALLRNVCVWDMRVRETGKKGQA